ncbi:hypothetical protein OMK64_07430 [Cellulomonas fimi]|uniref:hypothetical protein n=1 Tax=Cellulomonas fimi TaxID=1708 RepID=UPI00234CAC1C|nr:hypothetical protein [Cellulomonas fimi]MDC7121365.1 hypothetical protein [Cellulomonas fimi]
MTDVGDRRRVDDALRWLSHPTTCVAVVALLVNDHVLKSASGAWWTGKLSDAAGLLVAPPLVAVALAVVGRQHRPPRTRAATAVAVVGVLFAVVKLTAAGAAVASAAWSLVDAPGVVRRDPSDLLVLPVLVVAWWVGARGPTPGAPPRDRAPARWLVVLPVAVLATVATSAAPPPDEVRSVDVVDDAVVVRLEDGSGLRSTDGTTWRRATDDEARALADAALRGTPADVACVPARPDECYRPLPRDSAGGHLGVERSTDGGRTWDVDWSVPDEVLPALAARHDAPVSTVATRQVAVLPTQDGFRVLAANGADGLALRDEDGVWQRLGHPTTGAPAPVVPVPTRPDTPRAPLPLGVLAGVAAALTVVAAAGRPGTDLSAARRATGVGLLVAAGAVLAGALALDLSWRSLPGVDELVLVGRVVALVGVLAVALGLLGGAAGALRRGTAFGVGALVGVAVAIAVLVVGSPWVCALLAVGATAGGVALVRRAASRQAPWPDEPLPWGPLPGSS